MRRLADGTEGRNQYGANADENGTGKRVAGERLAEYKSRKDRIED
jgi:hypothetical protein